MEHRLLRYYVYRRVGKGEDSLPSVSQCHKEQQVIHCNEAHYFTQCVCLELMTWVTWYDMTWHDMTLFHLYVQFEYYISHFFSPSSVKIISIYTPTENSNLTQLLFNYFHRYLASTIILIFIFIFIVTIISSAVPWIRNIRMTFIVLTISIYNTLSIL